MEPVGSVVCGFRNPCDRLGGAGNLDRVQLPGLPLLPVS